MDKIKIILSLFLMWIIEVCLFFIIFALIIFGLSYGLNHILDIMLNC